MKNWPEHRSVSKRTSNDDAVEVTQPTPGQKGANTNLNTQQIKSDIKTPITAQSPNRVEDLSAGNKSHSPEIPMNQRFFELYQKADITERLRHSVRLEKGDKLSTSLTSQSVYTVKTRNAEVRIYSSFDSNLDGCISIGENVPIQGSTADSSVEVFKLPEEYAFAIIVRSSALVVIYADVEKWGQARGDEEPRLMLYYRKNVQGKWDFQGKGEDGLFDPSQYRSQMQFCDFPNHRS